MSWVIGEALIDLLPSGSDGYQPIVGGGAANTAVALARVDIPTAFVGGISTDRFGELIKRTLLSSGVDLSKAHVSNLPTAVAKLNLDSEKVATYSFSLENTATFDYSKSWLPDGLPTVIHVGSLATILEPGSTQILDWIQQFRAPIVYDPNVRPSVIDSKVRYREFFERWARISSVIKMSEEDLEWLYPSLNSSLDLLNFGPKLIVITRGPKGITGFDETRTVNVPAETLDVKDTVGAGDTVGAILMESIYREGLSNTIINLKSTLERAARAAAITCSRAGANPPWKSEL